MTSDPSVDADAEAGPDGARPGNRKDAAPDTADGHGLAPVGQRRTWEDIAVPVTVAFVAKGAVLTITWWLLDQPADVFQRLALQLDGAHYIGIAQATERFAFDIPSPEASFAFLYPRLIKSFGGTQQAALAISNVCSLAAVGVIAWHWGRKPACFFALFPTWIVFGTAAYSEGLYVLLAATALALIERNANTLLAGAAAVLAVFARYLGGPALLLGALPWRSWRDPWRYGAPLMVAAAGAGLVVVFWQATGSFFGFWEVQKPWGGKLAWPWEHYDWLLHGWFTTQMGVPTQGNFTAADFVVRDALYTMVALWGTALLWRRHGGQRVHSFVYSLVIVATAVCTVGTPATALPRYVVAAFPALAALGTQLRTPLAWIAYAAGAVMLGASGMAHHLYGYFS